MPDHLSNLFDNRYENMGRKCHLIGRPLIGLVCSPSVSPSLRADTLTICSRKVATLPIITCSIVLCPGLAIHCIIDDRKSSFKYANEKSIVSSLILLIPSAESCSAGFKYEFHTARQQERSDTYCSSKTSLRTQHITR